MPATMMRDFAKHKVNKLAMCYAVPPSINRRHQLMTQPHLRQLDAESFATARLGPQASSKMLFRSKTSLSRPAHHYKSSGQSWPKQNMITKASRINQQHGPPTDPALTEGRYPRRFLSPNKLHGGESGAGVFGWFVRYGEVERIYNTS
jgi:hypothetical protein